MDHKKAYAWPTAEEREQVARVQRRVFETDAKKAKEEKENKKEEE